LTKVVVMPQRGHRVLQQIMAAAVDGFLCNDVVACLRHSLNGVGDGRCAGGQCQCRHAAFQCCDAFFQHILRGVGQSAVDIACIRQAKAGSRVAGIPEHIGGCLIDGNRTGIGGRIRPLLTDMELKRFEFIVMNNHHFPFVFQANAC